MGLGVFTWKREARGHAAVGKEWKLSVSFRRLVMSSDLEMEG